MSNVGQNSRLLVLGAAILIVMACRSPFSTQTPTPPPNFLQVESLSPTPSLHLSEPSLNADGRYLAAFGPILDVVEPAIYVIDADDETIVYESVPGSLPWTSMALSPDGTLIAVCEDSSTPEERQLRIHLIDWRTDTTTYLVDGCFPAWSPDGHQLAFTHYTGNFGLQQTRAQIRLLDLASGEEETIFDVPSPTALIYDASWSPDGERLAFTMDPAFEVDAGFRVKRDLYTIRANGDEFNKLTDAKQIMSPTFLGNSQKILYVVWTEIAQTPNKLEVVDLNGDCRRIPSPVDVIIDVSLSTDGETIALTTNSGLLVAEFDSVVDDDFWTTAAPCD